ncbi:MAG: hypothetical protein KF773_23740 [Deltaproteobacteria bacterium]|nr:hypothetical protein [Deltaproteobacteria bacterium]
MRTVVVTIAALAALAGGASAARAETNVSGDGFCDFVVGRASADAALMYAPQVFAEIGRLEQPSNSINPVEVGEFRFIGGVRYRLTGILEGNATKERAFAECRRHQALEQIRGQTLYRALDAKAKLLDGALPEAEKILAQVNADFEARRTTAPEATATRLRVEELRRIANDTRTQRSLLPPPRETIGGLAAYQRADDDVEAQEARLRKLRAFDVTLRAGVNPYLDASAAATAERSPYFAVISASVNLGTLFQGKGNERAAAGRRAYVRSGRDPLTSDATADRLRTLAEAAHKRVQETSALEADLGRQIETLGRLGGDESKRYRQTIWFDWQKVRAERAYYEAYADALQQVLGAAP